jgi:hypothetical protein
VSFDEQHLRRAISVQNANNARLLAIPGVRQVELGVKQTDGASTGEAAIRVHVDRKRPAATVPAAELIPAAIDGIPVDVADQAEEARAVTIAQQVEQVPGALVTDDKIADPHRVLTQRPLVGGLQLTANTAILQGEHRGSPSASGTLGLMLWDTTETTDAQQHRRGFALTCQHVLDAEGQGSVGPDTDAGVPDISTKSTCCGTDNLVGKYFVGEHPSTASDWALVQLRPGMRWRPQILEIGVIPPHAPVGLNELMTLINNAAQVFKRGIKTGRTGGTIRALNVVNGRSQFPMRIRPNDPAPSNPLGRGDRWCFADHGDSGAAIVDGTNRVLGIVSGREGWLGEVNVNQHGTAQQDANGVTRLDGIGVPIHVILARITHLLAAGHPALRIAVATGTDTDEFIVPDGGASIAVPSELHRIVDTAAFLGGRDPDGVLRAPVGRAWFTEDDQRAERLATLRQAIAATGTGRQLNTFWAKHQRELLALVNDDRRVTLAWHRGGASAVFQAFIRLLSRPGNDLLAVPETINGTPVGAVVAGFAATLAERGSAGLAADIADLTLPDIAGRTLDEMLIAMEAVRG